MKSMKMKLAKKSLAVVLACSIAASPSLAFANVEEGTNEDDLASVKLDSVLSEDTNVAEITSEDFENEDIQSEDEELEAVSLVPGDFFYFVKVALEKIKLALTFDDQKEAEILADYATERLKEAEVLMNEGNEEKALETIEKAIEYLSEADEIVDVEDDFDSEDENSDEDNNADENNDEDNNDDENIDDETTPVEESDNNEEETVEQVISQNIIALTNALAKVKNPVAKEALQKNINKSYEKLAEKWAKFIENTETDEDIDVIDEDLDSITLPDEQPAAETDSDSDTEEKPVLDGQNKKLEHENKKQAKQEEKEERKQQKQIIKEEKKQQKQEAKEERKQVKEQQKKAKKEAKKEKKAEKNKNKDKKGNPNK